MGADAGFDAFEGGVVVDVPAGGDDVLGGAAPDEEAALLVVEAEAHQVGGEVVVVHADGVGAEAAPVGEAPGLDDDVAEVDGAEDGGGVVGGHRWPARKSARRHAPLTDCESTITRTGQGHRRRRTLGG